MNAVIAVDSLLNPPLEEVVDKRLSVTTPLTLKVSSLLSLAAMFSMWSEETHRLEEMRHAIGFLLR